MFQCPPDDFIFTDLSRLSVGDVAIGEDSKMLHQFTHVGRFMSGLLQEIALAFAFALSFAFALCMTWAAKSSFVLGSVLEDFLVATMSTPW